MPDGLKNAFVDNVNMCWVVSLMKYFLVKSEILNQGEWIMQILDF